MERLERLINLVIALRETNRPLSAAYIHANVAGYDGPENGSWRRRFERDKKTLRELGVPITDEPIQGPEQTGYRILPREYDLEPIDLTPEELTALAVAVQRSGLGDDASFGVQKLNVGAAETVTFGPVPVGLDLESPHRPALTDAVVNQQAVTFEYWSKGAAGPRVRNVDPHSLLWWHGRWYVVGRDREKNVRRIYRLDRIQNGVEVIGAAEHLDDCDRWIEPAELIPGAKDGPDTVTVRCRQRVAWQVARRARGPGQIEDDETWRRYTILVWDKEEFTQWLLGMGPDVIVVEPVSFVSSIVNHLRSVAEARS